VWAALNIHASERRRIYVEWSALRCERHILRLTGCSSFGRPVRSTSLSSRRLELPLHCKIHIRSFRVSLRVVR
jgi:hypothetical protein